MYRVRKTPSVATAAAVADSVAQTLQPPIANPTVAVSSPPPTSLLTLDRNSVLDFILCPKKFFNLRALPILQPPTLANPNPRYATLANRPPSVSQVVMLQDAMEFRQLCSLWDNVTVHKNSTLIRESDFEQAHVRTIDVVNDYFGTTVKKLGDGAPPLILHRPAIRSVIPCADRAVELRGRPAILHYYPKRREWRIYHTAAITDPLSDKHRAEKLMHSMLFDIHILQGWQKTSSLLSPESKAHLSAWETPPDGKSSSSKSAVHIDATKCAVLSIRPYISGPLTLQYHDTYTLSQFVVKTALSEVVTRAVGGKASDAVTANPWNLNDGLQTIRHHAEGASKVLCGSIDERRRRLWSALSRDGNSTEDPKADNDFASLVSGLCKKDSAVCPLFSAGNCLPVDEGNSVFSMPGINTDKKSALWAANVRTLAQVAQSTSVVSTKDSFKDIAVKLNKGQSKFIDAKLKDRIQVNPAGVDSWLSSIRYPAFFLDFESVQFALPPFEQSKPYQAIAFQFSMDVFHDDILTETPKHYDFLYLEEPNCAHYGDPRQQCITKLMDAIRAERQVAKERLASRSTTNTDDSNDETLARTGKAKKVLSANTKGVYRSENRKMSIQPWDGTVVAHFATFEKNVLQKASHLLPQFKDEIANMVFLDTIDLVKAGLVHPAALGSTSLKKLVPALLSKEEQYSSFDNLVSVGSEDASESSADGSSAASLFRLWRQRGAADLSLVSELQAARAQAERAGWERVRHQLLQYCNADTRNMYLVVRAVQRIVNESRQRGDTYDAEGWNIQAPERSVGNNGKVVAATKPKGRKPRSPKKS